MFLKLHIIKVFMSRIKAGVELNVVGVTLLFDLLTLQPPGFSIPGTPPSQAEQNKQQTYTVTTA